MKNALKGTIDRFEGDKAVIKTNDGQQILWPKENLSLDFKEGSVIDLLIINEKAEARQREEQAKTLLNEILKTEE